MKGVVKFFNESKGFGFIVGEDKIEYFVHKSEVLNNESIDKEDNVSFEVGVGDKGPVAKSVMKVS